MKRHDNILKVKYVLVISSDPPAVCFENLGALVTHIVSWKENINGNKNEEGRIMSE